MQLSDVFLNLGEEGFQILLRGVSMGRLRTYQLYDRMKVRLHLNKLNSESLRKSAPRLWTRLSERDEELATELAQAVLVCHLDMIRDVLDFLGIPHEDGFFAKDAAVSSYMTEGWQERVYEKFIATYPKPLLVFYLNHLLWEVNKDAEMFAPAA
jgi:hypothetical protein